MILSWTRLPGVPNLQEQSQEILRQRESLAVTSKTIEQYRTGTAGNTVEQVSAGGGKYDAGMGNVIDISRGRAAGGVKGQIDRQAASEYKNQSLLDGAEVIQRHQSGAEPVIGDTGTIESYKGDVGSESGWREVSTPHGTWFVMDGITAKAKFSNYSANTALNNRSEMTVSASSGLQNEVRWTHLATDNKQFSRIIGCQKRWENPPRDTHCKNTAIG